MGDVPLEWYKDEEHVGYDIEGRKIKKRDREAGSKPTLGMRMTTRIGNA